MHTMYVNDSKAQKTNSVTVCEYIHDEKMCL